MQNKCHKSSKISAKYEKFFIMGLQRSKDFLNGKIIKTTLLFFINCKQPGSSKKSKNERINFHEAKK